MPNRIKSNQIGKDILEIDGVRIDSNYKIKYKKLIYVIYLFNFIFIVLKYFSKFSKLHYYASHIVITFIS